MGDNMFKNKKNIKKFRIIGFILLSITFVIASIFFINKNRELSTLEKLLKDGTLFIGKIFTAPINYISNKIEEANEKNNLYEKYQELETKVESFEMLNSEKEELEHEIQELKEVIGINHTLSEHVKMNALVVGRNIDYWHDTITIDKGIKNGIVEGMPVITNKGLIGKIVSVSNFNSTVGLLTSSSVSKISVKIANGDNYVYGLLSGYDVEDNIYYIEGISNTIQIQKDAVVTTTGMGDIFPSGILIGKVVGIKSDSYNLASLIEVSPSVDFNDFSIVTILKRNADE